jgi:hypothetical protein
MRTFVVAIDSVSPSKKLGWLVACAAAIAISLLPLVDTTNDVLARHLFYFWQVILQTQFSRSACLVVCT